MVLVNVFGTMATSAKAQIDNNAKVRVRALEYWNFFLC